MAVHPLVLLLFFVSVIGGISANHGCRGCSNDRWFRLIDRVMECGKSHRHDHRVAFMAKFSNDIRGNGQKHEILAFNHVITNTGNGYNNKTGIFTAPTQGIYSFSWSILNYPNHQVYTELARNGNQIMANHADSINTRRSTCTTNAVLYLKKGDKVWIRRYSSQSTTMHGGIWSSFQGMKL